MQLPAVWEVLAMAKLIVRFEGKIIQELDFNTSQEYIAGRDENCQILLKGRSGVSRQHFKIYYNGTQWQVDVLSKFGHINFQAQEVDSILLEDGNVFSLSPFEFQFLLPKATEEKQPDPVVAQELDNPPATIENNDTLAIESSIKNNTPAITNNDEFQGDDEKTAVGYNPGEPIIRIYNNSDEELAAFELRDGSVWIAGREDTCDIKIPDKKASRKHFEISKAAHGFTITDLGSSNGTFLNGKKLNSDSSTTINSGDMISVASTKILFALKNSAIEQQIKNLPDVLFNQTVVAPVLGNLPQQYNSHPNGTESNLPEYYPSNNPLNRFELNPKILAIAALVLFCIYILTSEVKDGDSKSDGAKVIQVDDKPANKLSPSQLQFVKESYAAAQSLHQQGKYQLAASELEKIHKLIPYYENSKELEQECASALKALEELHANENEEQKAKERRDEIIKIVADCKAKFKPSSTQIEVDTCLQRAIELDPENTEVVALQKQAITQDEAKKIAENQKLEYAEKVKNGIELFNKAERLRKSKELYRAIAAYEEFLRSTLPDPQNNRKLASEQLNNIKKTIGQMIDDLLRQAKDFNSKEDFKQAQSALETARKVSPNDDKIAEVEDQVRVSQKQKLQVLFQEAKFEESLGNVLTLKEKCGKIKSMSFPDNEYHTKCLKILKKYGE